MNTLRVTCKAAENLPLNQLMEFQGELKRLSKRNLERLKSRIIEDGFNVPFFVWENGGEYMILDGHQRLKALVSLHEDGWEIPLLPVAFIEAEDEADARKKLLAISSQYGEFDAEELGDWLQELGDDIAETLRLVDGDLEIPTDQEEREDALVDPDPRINEADRLQAKWGTARGQLWQLGDHRILCGDATSEKEVAFLLKSGGGGRSCGPHLYGPSLWRQLYRREQSQRSRVDHDRERRLAG